MNNELYELQIIKPNWYAKDWDEIEDYNRATKINVGVVMGNPEDITELIMNYNNNKQELFDDYKEFKENIKNNKMKLDLNEIDSGEYVKNEREIVNKVKEKYKISLEKLIELFFKEPLKNQYEYNLARNIPQNFIEINEVWHSLGSGESKSRVDTKRLVYEANDFEFTDKCISIVPYHLQFIDLTITKELSNDFER